MPQVHDLRKKPDAAPEKGSSWDPPGRGPFSWWDLFWFGEPIVWVVGGIVLLIIGLWR